MIFQKWFFFLNKVLFCFLWNYYCKVTAKKETSINIAAVLLLTSSSVLDRLWQFWANVYTHIDANKIASFIQPYLTLIELVPYMLYLTILSLIIVLDIFYVLCRYWLSYLYKLHINCHDINSNHPVKYVSRPTIYTKKFGEYANDNDNTTYIFNR